MKHIYIGLNITSVL